MGSLTLTAAKPQFRRLFDDLREDLVKREGRQDDVVQDLADAVVTEVQENIKEELEEMVGVAVEEAAVAVAESELVQAAVAYSGRSGDTAESGEETVADTSESVAEGAVDTAEAAAEGAQGLAEAAVDTAESVAEAAADAAATVETAVDNINEKVEEVGFLGLLTEALFDPLGFLTAIFTPHLKPLELITSLVTALEEDPIAAITSDLELLAGLATSFLSTLREDPIGALSTALSALGITTTSLLTLILSHILGLPTGGLVGHWALVAALEALGIVQTGP